MSNELRQRGGDAAKSTGHGVRAISEFDQATSVFLGVRQRLFGIAYQHLGSVSEAEDIVQEAWLRWQCTDRTVVRNPTAFLVATTTRLAINVIQSAHRRRVIYPGAWLPEPVEASDGPETEVERSQTVESAVLLLLEKLSPTERAAYVLREAFGYPYGRISEALHIEAANARQLVRRAHQHIAAERRQAVHPAEHRRLVKAFLAAARAGNLDDLEELLAQDIAS